MGYAESVLLGRRLRKILKAVGYLFAAALVLVLSLPLWFPWVLRPIAALGGVRYSQYQRQGYSRFQLTQVRVSTAGTQATAKTFAAPVPTAWLWRLATETASPSDPYVQVADWELQSRPSTRTKKSTDAQIRLLERKIAGLTRWLPSATLSNGVVRAQGFTCPVPLLAWTGSRLRAEIQLPAPSGPVSATADFTAQSTFYVHLVAQDLHLESRATVASTFSGTDVQAQSSWWSNRVDFSARFARAGALPASALLQAPQLRVPAQALKLPLYQDLTGGASANWTQGVFQVDLHLAAEPLSSSTNSPPLSLELKADGTTNEVTLRTARLTSPLVSAEVSPALVLDLNHRRLEQPVSLKVVADLSQQSWFPVHGNLQGSADLIPSFQQFPTARFSLSGSDVGRPDFRAQTVNVRGNFAWPSLNLANTELRFDDGSSASLSGQLDLTNRVVKDGHFQFSGPLLKRWLPSSVSYQNLQASADFHGVYTNLLHQGELSATQVLAPPFRPLQLKADWQGSNLALSAFNLHLSTTNSSLALAGDGAAGADQGEIRLRSLTLVTNQQPALTLAQPFSIRLEHPAATNGWRLDCSPIDLAGPGGRVRAEATVLWPREGRVNLSLSALRSSLFAGLVQPTLPSVSLHRLKASAAWTNGPLTFSSQASLSIEQPDALQPPPAQPGTNPPALGLARQAFPIKADFVISGAPAGLTVSNLDVYSRTSRVCVVRGSVPVTVNLAGTNLLHLDTTAPLHLVADVETNTPAWDELGKWVGISLSRPQLKLDVSGTWARPAGLVSLSAQQVKLDKLIPRMPALENLNFVLHLDRNQARLTQGRLIIQGQPITIVGQLPLGSASWQ
ncbi:MAG TPA: hypothetical protein VHI52_20420, partial [Verrucomicrobiae bacterium]|nr:hypothetical protein [Verrucomicrobiae bacterium]